MERVEPETSAWGRVVDDHISQVWAACRDAGLDETDAAVVTQLTWLRLAQRWPETRDRLAEDAARNELRKRLTEGAREEAEALAAQRASRRDRERLS